MSEQTAFEKNSESKMNREGAMRGRVALSVEPFYLKKGKVIQSLKELAEALILMNDEEFAHHVSSQHNDFANWVEHCFHDTRLAEKIRAAQSRDDAFLALLDVIEKKETANELISQEEKQTEEKETKKAEVKPQDTTTKISESNLSEDPFESFQKHESDVQDNSQNVYNENHNDDSLEKEQDTIKAESVESTKENTKENAEKNSEQQTEELPSLEEVQKRTQELKALLKEDGVDSGDGNKTNSSFDQKETNSNAKEKKIGLFRKIREQFRRQENIPEKIIESVTQDEQNWDAQQEKRDEFIKVQQETQAQQEDEILTPDVQIPGPEHSAGVLGKNTFLARDDSKGNARINVRLEQAFAQIERLHAQHEALNEARKISNQRFIQVAEEQGSMRSNFLNIARQMEEVLVRTAKAVDLVEAIQPQQFNDVVLKQQTRIESLAAKIESNHALNERVLEELHEIREKMAAFRGLDQVLKLNQEVSEKLLTIQKIKVLVERHADRTENMFANVKKSFERFEKFEQIGKDMQENTNSIIAEFEKVKSQTEGAVSKDDLAAIRQDVESSSEVLLGQINEIKDAVSALETKTEAANSNASNTTTSEDMFREKSRNELEEQKTQIRDLLERVQQIEKEARETHGGTHLMAQRVRTLIHEFNHVKTIVLARSHQDGTEEKDQKLRKEIVAVFKELKAEMKELEEKNEERYDNVTHELKRLGRGLNRQEELHERDMDAFSGLRKLNRNLGQAEQFAGQTVESEYIVEALNEMKRELKNLRSAHKKNKV